MSHRHSLLSPSTESSRTHRRSRSADARLKPSFYTPTTFALEKPVSPKLLQPQSTSTSSDEDEDDTTSTCKESQIMISRSDSSLPRPSLAKFPGISQPKTSARIRCASDRQVATDPGYYRKTGSTTFNDTAIIYPQDHWPCCGYRSYVRLSYMHKHEQKCSKCQELLLK
jgi:hypothetical protein